MNFSCSSLSHFDAGAYLKELMKSWYPSNFSGCRWKNFGSMGSMSAYSAQRVIRLFWYLLVSPIHKAGVAGLVVGLRLSHLCASPFPVSPSHSRRLCWGTLPSLLPEVVISRQSPNARILILECHILKQKTYYSLHFRNLIGSASVCLWVCPLW